jgi:hypothetical protein
MDFAQFDVPAGQRLGVALSTERSGTTFDAGLQILYDHHLTPSRIEVETTTPLDLAGIPSLAITNPNVTTLPATLTGELRRFVPGQTVTYRLDDPSVGTVLAATTTPTPTPSSGPASVSLTLPAGVANGAHTIYAIGSAGDVTGRQINVNVTRVNSAIVVKSNGCKAGYIRKSGATTSQYYVYADVSGTPGSVTANVTNLTTGQTAVPLTAGTYNVDGNIYNYRSALLTAGSTLVNGSTSFTVTPAAGSAFTGSAVIDSTAPTPVDVQTINKTGGVAGLPEIGDTVVLTYSEPVGPCSLVAGWDGLDATDVVVYFSDAGTKSDSLSFWDAATGLQMPLGTIDLGPTRGDYTGSANAIFGYGGTPGALTLSGNTIRVVLGSLYSGSVKTVTSSDTMKWTPSASATDYAGNAGTTTVTSESGVADKEF